MSGLDYGIVPKLLFNGKNIPPNVCAVKRPEPFKRDEMGRI